MYDDEEDQQNSERSDNPDEIGSDPSMLMLSPQKVHTGWRTVVVPWQDQSLSLEFFGVPLPPTPTTAIRIERFSFFYLWRSIRFRLFHIPELVLTLSPPINFLSLRNVSRLDLGRIDMPFDFSILRNLPCLTHLAEPLSHIDVSHIIPHARKPYFPPLTHSLGLFYLCGFFVGHFLLFDFGMTNFLLALLIFWLFDFFDFFLSQAWGEAIGGAATTRPQDPSLANVNKRLWDDDFEIGDGIDNFSWDDGFEIGDLSENVGSLNDLIGLSRTTETSETSEGRIEPTWPEYQSANPALAYFLLALLIFWLFEFLDFFLSQARGKAIGGKVIKPCEIRPPQYALPLWDDDFEIGDDSDNFSRDDYFEIGDGIDNFSWDDDFGSLNDLIGLSQTRETLEGRVEPTWPECQPANPALEQHTAILPLEVPHVMTRNNAVTVTTLQMETDKSSLLSPRCLSGSIAQSCPVPTLVTCFLEEERSVDIMNSSIELPCSDPAPKLPTVTTARGSAEEERYGKIINPSMELYSRPQCIEIPRPAGPALPPDAFANVGNIMLVDSSEQESSVRFDATNIGGNVVSANKNCTTTCSQKKITNRELLPLIGLTREAAAEKIGVSIPTFKRHCRLNHIFRWPHHRNKKQCLSLRLKLAADSDQGAAGAFGHFVTGSHTGAVGSNHHNSPCSKPPKRQREKKTSPSCKTPSTLATCSDPAPGPMQAMSTFPQIMPHLRAGQDARTEISKTTEDILIQSVEGMTTRSCLSPQDVPSTSSPKHFHCTEMMGQMLESSRPAPKGQLQEQSTFHLPKQNAGTAIIKAKYGNKTVKVPPPATSGIVKLKEELARRLDLEHGSFYVEYEDEDHDWILIACDDALQECLTSSTSRDNRVIRLSVRDEVVNSQNSGKALEC